MMKKQLMLLVFVISMGSLCAQAPANEKTRPNYYQQGEKMLSLSPNFGWSRRGAIAGTGLTIGGLLINSRVTAGKFVKDKLFLGSSFAYSGAPFADITNSQFKAGLLSRYYVTKRGFSPFIEANAGYYRDNFYLENFTALPQNGMYVGARMGVEYRVGKLGIEASLGKEWRTGGNYLLNRPGQRPFQVGVNFHF
jgi:hypothetical protein